MQWNENTHRLNIETMINHAKLVSLGVKKFLSCRYAQR